MATPTSAVCAENHIIELEEQIAKVNFPKSGEDEGQICPRVFKKDAKTKKAKLVDMSIAIDALRHSTTTRCRRFCS